MKTNKSQALPEWLINPKNPNTLTKALKRAPNLIENLMWLEKIQDIPCKDCGQIFPRVCMDFHHINENEKHSVLKNAGGFTIRKMVMSGYSIKTIKRG